MKTIAITIDSQTLKGIMRLEKKKGMNRSEIFREAAAMYVAQERRIEDEERERKIFRRHKRKLFRQSTALIKEQAEL